MWLLFNSKLNYFWKIINKQNKRNTKGKKRIEKVAIMWNSSFKKKGWAGFAPQINPWIFPPQVVLLTFLGAHFHRHGLLLAWGMSGSNGDQVGGAWLEASQNRRVVCSVHGCGTELAPGQGRVLNVVTCDRLQLKRAPAEANTGCSGLGNCHHGRAQHLWCGGTSSGQCRRIKIHY